MSDTGERMTCPKCKASNFATSAVCWQCGSSLEGVQPDAATAPPEVPAAPAPPQAGYVPAAPQSYGPKPQNYLVWAILSTLFCCMPLGVVSIVFAAQVDGKYNSGDTAGAEASSKSAKAWAWASFGVGLAATLIYVVFMVVGIIASTTQH
jgi:hypothetical protein